MLKNTGKENKADVYELWKHSYVNQSRNDLNFYFKYVYDNGRCIAIEENQKIISALQINEHVLSFKDKQLKVSYIYGVATHPDYRRNGYMRKLMEAALEEVNHNHLITFIYGFYPKLYKQFGFETIYERKVYGIPREYLNKVSQNHIAYDASPLELLQVYQQYTQHFDGYYVRNQEYYKILLNELLMSQKQLIVYRNDEQKVSGYLIYSKRKHEVYVEEAIYLESVVLLRMLKSAIQDADEIYVEVSQSEKLEKLFPLVIPKKQPFIMARVNNIDLFNKLFNTNVKTATEAFHSVQRPLWIHEMY